MFVCVGAWFCESVLVFVGVCVCEYYFLLQ